MKTLKTRLWLILLGGFLVTILLISLLPTQGSSSSVLIEIATISGNDGEAGNGEFFMTWASDTSNEMSYNNPDDQAISDESMTSTVTHGVYYNLHLWEDDAFDDDDIHILKLKIHRDLGSNPFTIDTETLSEGYTYTVYVGGVAYISYHINYRDDGNPNGNFAVEINPQ